jgi:glycosyltransferase involved in cell wall biosynthesis
MLEVDVIIPFHRPVDKFLMSAIDAAEKSSNVSVHLILVNDRESNWSSTVDLRKKGYSVIQSNNRGYAECINLGIQNSETNYISFLNSDDLQLPQRLSRQINQMKVEGTNMSISRLRKFVGGRRIMEMSGRQPNGEFNKLQLLLGAYGANASLVQVNDVSRRKLFNDVDMSDWEYAFRYYPNRVSFLNEEMYLYRMHPNQISRHKQNSPKWLFNEWSKLFETISRESISSRVIEACCRPNLLTKLDPSEWPMFIRVLKDIQSNLLSMGQYDRNEINQLVLRRYIFASKIGSMLNKNDLASVDATYSSVVEIYSKLSFEFLVNSRYNRKQ